MRLGAIQRGDPRFATSVPSGAGSKTTLITRKAFWRMRAASSLLTDAA